MKKYIIIMLVLILTGCADESSKKSEVIETEVSKTVITTNIQNETVEETTEAAELTTENDILPDNIEKIDLSLPENSKYTKDLGEFTYNEEYELPDRRKIVEDKSIYLEELSGERTTLIEIPEEYTEQYAVFCDMIDENRFYYYIIWHESTAGTGIYNLETSEDFRIDKTEDQKYHYVPYKIIGNSLLLKKWKIADCGGLAKLDLDSYEVTEFKCSFMESDKNYSAVDFSADGTKAAMYKRNKIAKNTNDMNEYKIIIYSIDNDSVLDNYVFSSKNDYINYKILYYSENQIYFYAYYFEDHPKSFQEASENKYEPKCNLYIINC